MWQRSLAATVGTLFGAFLIFTGVYALTTGSYYSPGAELLGGHVPWRELLSLLGIPLGDWMRIVFVALGSLWIVGSVLTLLGVRAALPVTVLIALLSLWFVPVGTLLSIAVTFFTIAFRKEITRRARKVREESS